MEKDETSSSLSRQSASRFSNDAGYACMNTMFDCSSKNTLWSLSLLAIDYLVIHIHRKSIVITHQLEYRPVWLPTLEVLVHLVAGLGSLWCPQGLRTDTNLPNSRHSSAPDGPRSRTWGLPTGSWLTSPWHSPHLAISKNVKCISSLIMVPILWITSKHLQLYQECQFIGRQKSFHKISKGVKDIILEHTFSALTAES